MYYKLNPLFYNKLNCYQYKFPINAGCSVIKYLVYISFIQMETYEISRTFVITLSQEISFHFRIFFGLLLLRNQDKIFKISAGAQTFA